jgi:hypothetical protein
MFGGGGNMGNMLKQAQQLQANVQKAQAEIAAMARSRLGARRSGESKSTGQGLISPSEP